MRVAYTTSRANREYLIQRLIETAAPAPAFWSRWFKTFLPITLIMAGVFWLLVRSMSTFVQITSIGGVVICGLAWLPLSEKRVRTAKARELGARLLDMEKDAAFSVEMDGQGIRIDNDGTVSIHPWRTVSEFREMPQYLELVIGRMGLVVIDKSAFESETQLKAFFAAAQAYRTTQQPPA